LFDILDLYNCFILNKNNITAGCKNMRVQNKIEKYFHCIKIEIEMKENIRVIIVYLKCFIKKYPTDSIVPSASCQYTIL